MPGLGDMARAPGRGVRLAAEEDEIEGLSAGQKGRRQLGYISTDPGRRRAERAAVDTDSELMHVVRNSKLKTQNSKRRELKTQKNARSQF
jgi:hypothetical protein